ncbi:MAG TPA: hypothetical protein VHP11_10195, partial [Tepidisphaeraceae bacterium]|nr:hypothetical protein [Tepidisphaeraceae bacterium]
KIGGIVIALVLAFQVLLLPPIIHLALSIALRGMGLTDTSFQVRAASFFQTELAQFRINGQALARVGNIGFDYTPLSLLRGRVNSLWITGAEIQVSIQDGSITLGPLPLNELSSSPPSSSSSSKRLPFDQLELRSSALAVAWEGRQTWVPVEGSLLDLGGGKGKLDLLVRVQGGPVHVTGSFDRVGKALQLTADAPNLNAAALAAAIPAQFATLTPSVSSGTLSLQALYVQSPADTKLTASLAGTGLRLGANFDEHRLWMQNLGWSANVQFGAGLSLLAADLTATAERLSVDGEAAQNLVLSAKKEGPRLRLNATAQSPTWQLRKLDTTLTGLFDPQLRQPLVAETSFGVDAAIPRQIAKMLQFYRLDVSEMGSLSAEGQLALKLPPPKAPHPDQSWELSAKEIQIALAPGDLSIAKDTAVLRSLAGVLRLTGQANRQQATVQLMPGSNFWLSNIDQRLSPITFAKADPSAALASVGIESQPAQFTLRFNNPDHPWLFQAPAASLTLAETAITLPDQVTKAQGLGVSLRVRAQVDPQGIEAYALPGSIAGFKSFETLAAGYKLQAKPWQLNLGSQPGQPLVHISTASTADLPRFSFHAAAENALNAKNQALDLSIADLTLGGTLTLNPTTGPALQAQLALNNTSFAYTPQSARVAGISATIPISWNTFTSDRGAFAVKTLQVGDTTYPALAGAVSVTDQRLDFSANWPFLKDLATLNAQGWVDLAEQPAGQIVATIP